MPPAPNDFPAEPGSTRVRDGGDGLAEIQVTGSGPDSEPLFIRLAPADGGPPVMHGREDLQELYRVPPAFSADGTTVGLIRQGASPSGWVGERIELATGTRTPVVVPGPGDPFLPSDGRVLLVLMGCTTTPGDPCLLHGATAQPLGNIVGLAVADAEPKVLIALRDYDLSGTLVDQFVQFDLVTGTEVRFTPPRHAGLPQKRWLLRGNLLPLDRGVASEREEQQPGEIGRRQGGRRGGRSAPGSSVAAKC